MAPRRPERNLIKRILQELISTEVGLLAAASIAFMLGMGVYYLRYFLRHMAQDEATHPKA